MEVGQSHLFPLIYNHLLFIKASIDVKDKAQVKCNCENNNHFYHIILNSSINNNIHLLQFFCIDL